MAGWLRASWVAPFAVATSFCIAASLSAANGETRRADRFRRDIKPILTELCFDCHADGAKKGNVELDKSETDAELLNDRELWFNVLKYVRSDVMPPSKKPHPNAEQKHAILDWIKTDVFQIDPAHPNPGRVTVHRLNRAEYRNTIRDLMGVEFDTESEFPSDDTGFGFDNISEVLTISPLLLEKYLEAADSIVSKSVPAVPYVMAEQTVAGARFTVKAIEETPATTPASQPATKAVDTRQQTRGNSNRSRKPVTYLSLSYYRRASATCVVNVAKDGQYRLAIRLTSKGEIIGASGFDTNKARVAFSADGEELHRDEYAWNSGREFREEVEVDWKAGPHELQFDLTPLTPGAKQTAQLEMRIEDVIVRGPVDRSAWIRPPNYARYFPENTPDNIEGKKAAARKLLGEFAAGAFRRPVDEPSISRLTDLAERVWSAPGKTYEQGIAKAMTAILSSPRFLYREEQTLTAEAGQAPLIDEYSLASRLSYFLWSSMPDEELLKLAGKSELRKNLHAQVKRMLIDSKSSAFTENFTGQWLEARDVAAVPIDARRVADSEQLRLNKLQNDNERRLTRAALLNEVRDYFNYIVASDRDVIEFIDSDYTFLNERLATYYGVADVAGDDLRKVQLPPNSPRGGILTMGATLMVTSNPTRTSPVKRGQFILDNVLGIPSPPPPPDIPTLEESRGKIKDHTPTLREQLAIHREAAVCASCHNRMDPLGLALENFNALGLWRDKENGTDIDGSGVLITGENFKNIRELKKILAANDRKDDFYRCLTEKMLVYALGRGMDHQDVGTIDEIVSKLDREHGRFSALLAGVIDSPAFQRKQEH
jgi:hypothetical protein